MGNRFFLATDTGTHNYTGTHPKVIENVRRKQPSSFIIARINTYNMASRIVSLLAKAQRPAARMVAAPVFRMQGVRAFGAAAEVRIFFFILYYF